MKNVQTKALNNLQFKCKAINILHHEKCINLFSYTIIIFNVVG